MDVYMGTVMSFGFNFPPKGWIACNGQLLSVNSNQALYSLLGTTYGGDGVNTFALPNLQGRAIIGRGTDASQNKWAVGQMGGTASTTVLLSQLPAHTHAATTSVNIPAFSDNGSTPDPNGNSFAISSGSNLYTTGATDTALKPFQETLAVGMAGGSQPFNNTSPFQVVNYSIAVSGLYPSRN